MAEGKICIYCGEDCSGRPRVKDPQGRYACKRCVERQGSQRPARTKPIRPEPIEEPIGLDNFGGDGGLEMGDLLSEAHASDSNLCPSCGTPRASGAVVCMRCGYNSQTGDQIATSVTKVKEPKEGNDVDRRIVSIGWIGPAIGFVAMIALPFVGSTSEAALAGTFIAAALWSLVAWVMMIVAAFRDDEGKWGIIGLCTLVPCLGGICWLAFTFYYCTFGSERIGWKLNYWFAVIASTSIQIIAFVQYPGLLDEFS